MHQISLENKKYIAFREYLKTHNYLLASMNEEDFMFSISKEEQIQLKKDIEVDLLIQKSKLDSLTKLQEKLQTKKIDDTFFTLISTQIEATTLLIEKRELEIEKLEEKFKELEIKKPVKKKPVKKTQAKKSTQVVALKPPIIGPPTIGLKALGMEIVDLNHTIAALEYKLESEKNKSIEPEIKLEQHFEFVEEVAVFPGGNDSMKIWLKQNLRYPADAKEAVGRAYMRFIVEVDGSISNVSVVKGVPDCPSCDQEAIRLVKSMPKWMPGKNGNRVVRQRAQIPINFTTD